MAAGAIPATKLAYFDNMWAVQATATLLSHLETEGGRRALILDSTIFHPQGGGQPADTGFISGAASGFKFVVEDARLKDGLVYHYGSFENPQDDCVSIAKEGEEVSLYINPQRRDLNSRLHSAGHLLDICIRKMGLSHLEPGKGYHFSDGPFVEYKGIIPPDLLQIKSKELEKEANALILAGGKVSAPVLSYNEAAECCGGVLPSYIPTDSAPRIVKLGEHPGCPCGGTHVADIADIRNLTVNVSCSNETLWVASTTSNASLYWEDASRAKEALWDKCTTHKWDALGYDGHFGEGKVEAWFSKTNCCNES